MAKHLPFPHHSYRSWERERYHFELLTIEESYPTIIAYVEGKCTRERLLLKRSGEPQTSFYFSYRSVNVYKCLLRGHESA